MRPRSLAAAVLAAACGAVVGCGDEAELAAEATTAAPAATAEAADPVAFPPACQKFVPKTTVAAPPELIAPAAVVVGQVAGEGGIQRASGYIAAEPGTFLAGVKSRGDLTFLDGENEGFEAEATVQSGTNQVFWKVKKVCDEGSTFTAIITTSGG